MTVFVFNKQAVEAHAAALVAEMNRHFFGTQESIKATRDAVAFSKIIRKLTTVSDDMGVTS